jgi:hypothetical protein
MATARRVSGVAGREALLQTATEMGAIQFGVPRDLVLWARDALDLRAFVETGTNKAETTAWASDQFEKVVTIEGQSSLVAAAIEKYGHRKNIKFLQGDSRTLMAPALTELDRPSLLWLDAHWCGEGTFGATAECPVLEELQAANDSPHAHAVLIDDARFFIGPPPPPHKQSDWPDLLEVTAALSAGKVRRYVVVHDDVIVAVPMEARDSLARFVQRARDARAVDRSSVPRKIARRILRELRARVS